MERLRGVCDDNYKVTLTLSSKRLTLLNSQMQFVLLADLKTDDQEITLRSRNNPDGFMYITQNPINRRIGCTFFSSRNWAKIRRAVAEAK